MKTTNTVGVRLRSDVWARYSNEAQRQGLSLGSYLRRILEDERLEGELASIRRALEQLTSGSRWGTDGDEATPNGAHLEMVLLLRSIAGPQRAALVQSEVERRGLETWR